MERSDQFLQQEVRECFHLIEQFFSEESLVEFKNTPKDELYLYHFGLGTWIRNNLLTDQSILRRHFIQYGVLDRDDMSSMIIRFYHQNQ